MPVAPNESILVDDAAKAQAVREYMSQLGRKGYLANLRKHGKAGRPFNKRSGARAGKAGWTPAKRAERERKAAEKAAQPKPSGWLLSP